MITECKKAKVPAASEPDCQTDQREPAAHELAVGMTQDRDHSQKSGTSPIAKTVSQ